MASPESGSPPPPGLREYVRIHVDFLRREAEELERSTPRQVALLKTVAGIHPECVAAWKSRPVEARAKADEAQAWLDWVDGCG